MLSPWQLTLIPGQKDILVLDLKGSGKLSSVHQKGLRESNVPRAVSAALGLGELVALWFWFG